jgi:citrate synthase
MRKMVDFTGQRKWMEMFDILSETMIKEKNIHPNLDFPSGPAYYMMGFEIEMFTPIFAMARIAGWSAHIMEQYAANRIIRPLANYNGVEERDVTPLSSR